MQYLSNKNINRMFYVDIDMGVWFYDTTGKFYIARHHKMIDPTQEFNSTYALKDSFTSQK